MVARRRYTILRSKGYREDSERDGFHDLHELWGIKPDSDKDRPCCPRCCSYKASHQVPLMIMSDTRDKHGDLGRSLD